MNRREFIRASGVSVGGGLVAGLAVSAVVSGCATKRPGEIKPRTGAAPTGAAPTGIAPTGVTPNGVAPTSAVAPVSSGNTVGMGYWKRVRGGSLPLNAGIRPGDGSMVSQPESGDLVYKAHEEGYTSIEVVGGQSILSGPHTNASDQFHKDYNQQVLWLPGADAPLHSSEIMVYLNRDARRLGRTSAEGTTMFIRMTNEHWAALEVMKATKTQLAYSFYHLTPSEAP